MASMRAVWRHRASLTASPANSRRKPSRVCDKVVDVLLVFLDAGVQGVEPLDGVLGHDLGRPERRELLVQRRPLVPQVVDGQGGVGDLGKLFASGWLLLPAA